MNRHWSEPLLKLQIISSKILSSGQCNTIELVESVDHQFWIAKAIAPESWLGKTDPRDLELAAILAAMAENELDLCYAPYKDEHNQNLFKLNDNNWGILLPYCPGAIIIQPTLPQCIKLGNALAKLHGLNFRSSQAKPFPEVFLPDTKSTPLWIRELADRSNRFLYQDSEQWVLSHRDLHAQNIIWREEDTPHFIDWESMGLIHPFIELIGLAINCAGLAEQRFDYPCFYAVLMGYIQQNRSLPGSHRILWGQIYHSWLLWFAWCQRQGLDKEAQLTLDSIDLIKKHSDTMQTTYLDLARE